MLAKSHYLSYYYATLCYAGALLTYTQGDSGVISMPGGFRCHLVGTTLINVFHCESAEIRFVI